MIFPCQSKMKISLSTGVGLLLFLISHDGLLACSYTSGGISKSGSVDTTSGISSTTLDNLVYSTMTI